MKPVLLFVDDEPNILSGLRRMTRLGCDGWEILFADGGQQALGLIANRKVDAVVSDMRMPSVDGAALLQEVHDSNPHIIRFLLSGEADQALTCATVGISHQFFTKPCDARALVITLTAILEARNALAETMPDEALARIDRLPANPDVCRDVRALLDNEGSNFSAIADAIRRDSALAIRTLQLANSSYFGGSRTTCDIRTAVGAVGADVLRLLFERDAIAQSPVPQPNSTDIAEAALSAARSDGLADDLVHTAYAAGLLLGHAKANGWSTNGSTAPAAYLASLIGLPSPLVETLDRLRQVDNLQEPAETAWRVVQAIKAPGQEAA